MHRFDQLERCLIGTRSLAELIQILLCDFKTAFDHDAVTLALIDPEYEIARILEEEKGGGCENGWTGSAGKFSCADKSVW